MIRISVEMPAVAACGVSECAYNTESACHARAITVGNQVQPECDTYFNLGQSTHDHVKATQRLAGVGACKMFNCRFNEDFECMAEEVSVGFNGDMVSCLTYQHR